MKENKNWKFFTSAVEQQELNINGINIWEHKWQTDYESIIVKDPQYGDLKKFTKYWLDVEDETIEFVAGEFSNTIYGFYLKPELLQKQPKRDSKNIAVRIVKFLRAALRNGS